MLFCLLVVLAYLARDGEGRGTILWMFYIFIIFIYLLIYLFVYVLIHIYWYIYLSFIKYLFVIYFLLIYWFILSRRAAPSVMFYQYLVCGHFCVYSSGVLPIASVPITALCIGPPNVSSFVMWSRTWKHSTTPLAKPLMTTLCQGQSITPKKPDSQNWTKWRFPKSQESILMFWGRLSYSKHVTLM